MFTPHLCIQNIGFVEDKQNKVVFKFSLVAEQKKHDNLYKKQISFANKLRKKVCFKTQGLAHIFCQLHKSGSVTSQGITTASDKIGPTRESIRVNAKSYNNSGNALFHIKHNLTEIVLS